MVASFDILCSNLLNIKNKSTKIEHGPSKILKNISWSINICLKYFMTPTKPSNLTPIPSYILNVRSLTINELNYSECLSLKFAQKESISNNSKYEKLKPLIYLN